MDDYLVAAPEPRVAGALHGAGHVDATHGWILAHDPTRSVVRQRILVIDRRVLGADQDVARIELFFGHLDKAARNALVVLECAISLETVHR
jgi:hypothetical protein